MCTVLVISETNWTINSEVTGKVVSKLSTSGLKDVHKILNNDEKVLFRDGNHYLEAIRQLHVRAI